MNQYLKKWRVIFLCACMIAFAIVILVKYTKLALVKNIQTFTATPVVERGSIVDRNGKALAVSTNFYHFGVTPSAIKDIQTFSQLVSPVLQQETGDIIRIITDASNSRFVYIKKKIDQNSFEELQKICAANGFAGAVRFDRIPGRVYPENTLASQLIGYMGNDGIGLSGIEYSMQTTLSPVITPENPGDLKGKNVYLTIDANLQFKLEKIAHEAIQNTQAESLMLIAAEAKTGEIISYISLPEVNLNEYGKSSQAARIDRPATQSYEPGSVFKIFSVASFLDAGVISESEIFNCDGIYKRTTNSGETIVITCLDHHGWLTAREALKYSCNDALAQMSEKIESEPFLAKIRTLGFGSRTGVELPGETTGSVRKTSDRLWSARSKPTIAIGQEISVSALQMVQAATALANDGVPVQLTFISKITNHDGSEVFIHTPVLKDPVFKKKTANYLLSCMETVARSGTGTRANLGDVSIGVKTGTAQMADHVHGGYSKTDFLSNCIAIFPIEKPEIILYIVIEKAKGENYAGRIVAPVIAEAASAIIDHMGMSRGGAASLAHPGYISISDAQQMTVAETVPDFTGKSKRELLSLLTRPDIQVRINGDGWVISQNPPPGTPVTENMEIELYLE
ncbi:MAG: transpeptidase family protein [Treponema sp.]|nr:transpeptidase family protein [Treponema sp.]